MRIVIAGAGDLGREVAGWAHDDGIPVKDIIFLDDSKVPGQYIDSFLVDSNVADFLQNGQDIVVIAIANPRHRENISLTLAMNKAWVSRHARAVGSASYGQGAILMPHALLSVGAWLKRGCIIGMHSTVGHDVVMGDFCTLSSHVDLCGHVQVGKRVFFGSGCRVLPGLRIGDDAIIGPGACVMRDVPAGEVWTGNPARRSL